MPPEPCVDPEPDPDACPAGPPGRALSDLGVSLPDAVACADEPEPDGGTLDADPELVAVEEAEDDALAAGFDPACDP